MWRLQRSCSFWIYVALFTQSVRAYIYARLLTCCSFNATSGAFQPHPDPYYAALANEVSKGTYQYSGLAYDGVRGFIVVRSQPIAKCRPRL